jgi:replicative DNA helicase
LFFQAAEILTPDMFSLTANRIIYRRMQELVEDEQPIDMVMLVGVLETHGEVSKIGDMGYLSSLIDGVPERPSIVNYCQTIKSRYLMRGIINVAQLAITEAIEHPESTEEVLSRLEQGLLEITDAVVQDKPFVTLADSVQEAGGLDDYLHRVTDPITMSGIPTGYDIYDSMTGGLKKSEMVIIAARPSMGKAQPLDSRILARQGWKRFGDVRVGEYLASEDGRLSVVRGVFPQGAKQVYQVTFADGRSTECCAEHLWTVMFRQWKKPRTLSTQKLIEMLSRKRYRNRVWIETFSGDFGYGELPLDPWLLGVLIGNGSFVSGTPRFSSADSDTIARVDDLIQRYELTMQKFGEVDYRLSGKASGGTSQNMLTGILKQLGLYGHSSLTKFIPEAYKRAILPDRIALIQGLLDTDGNVEKTGSIIFATSSEQLAHDFVELARSVGAISNMVPSDSAFTYRGERRQGAQAYRCSFVHRHQEQFVWLKRKRDRIRPKRNMMRLTVSSITPTRVAECQCIQVSHPNGTYITDDYVVTHNTAFAMNVAENIVLRDPEMVIACFSIEMSARAILSRSLASAARVNLRRIQRGDYISTSENDKLMHALERLVDKQIYIDDSSGITPIKMRAKLRNLKRKKGRLDLVMIDYLQLMSSGVKLENRQQEVSATSRGVKALCKDFDLPFLVLAQLNRGVEGRKDTRPILSDLRESGQIEQDADTVGFIHRPEMYDPDPDIKGIAELIIGKQREGPVDIIKLAFIPEFTRFENLALP